MTEKVDGSSHQVTFTVRKQERMVPERDRIEGLQGLFYRLRKVTRKSIVRGSRNVERPLGLRGKRADLLKAAKAAMREAPVGEKAKVAPFAEARTRDEIAQHFLQQSEVKVSLPGLGEQQGRFLDLQPPDNVRTPESDAKPPIFLIPTISADLEPMSELIRELSYRGRRIVSVGYPESSLGKVTTEFADKVTATDTFEPHTDYFKTVIKAWMQEQKIDNIELWGVSSGAPIAAEILSDPSMQDVVSRAVFMAPAATADISSLSQSRGILNEAINMLPLPSPRFSLIWGRRESQPVESVEQVNDKKKIFAKLQEKITHYSPAWAKARVASGGEMVMMSLEKDDVTRSESAIDKIKQDNPAIRVISMPDARHSTPLIKPEAFVNALKV